MRFQQFCAARPTQEELSNLTHCPSHRWMNRSQVLTGNNATEMNTVLYMEEASEILRSYIRHANMVAPRIHIALVLTDDGTAL